MPRRRTFAIAALIAVLLVAVSGGVVIAHMSQTQARAASQSRPSTASQQTNPESLMLSGTPQAPSATYRKWNLVSFTFDGRSQALGSKVTVVFISDAQGLQVFAHICNGIGERYTWAQDHAHLIAQGEWQTLMLCKQTQSGVDIMALEANYVAALRQVTTYRLDQSGITLRDDAGLYVLRFVPAS